MESDAQVFEIGDRVRYLSRTVEGVALHRDGFVVAISRENGSGFVDVKTDSGYLVGIAIKNLEKLSAKK